MSVFISYSSADEEFAAVLAKALSANHLKAWFAPKDIEGGECFAQRIGRELSPHRAKDAAERIAEDGEHLTGASSFVMLLSARAMASRWVRREFLMADERGIPIQVLRIDHSELTEAFRLMLIDTQITEAYHLNPTALEPVIRRLAAEAGGDEARRGGAAERFTCEEIGIWPLHSGDPYFTEGETLRITLGKDSFFLAPPESAGSDPLARAYLTEHHFYDRDEAFGSELAQLCADIPVPGLQRMIEEARETVFRQFLRRENGCYYNNRKYGVARISGFERTENMAEKPILRLEMYTTDYFTHRVMKAVCKRLSQEMPGFIRKLNFTALGAEKILLTSLGINLILCDSGGDLLLTSRSTNAAETYRKHNYSVSVVEGVSLSDYDTFNQSVSMSYAALRGLQEELGVEEGLVRKDSLRFYDLFVNPANLELGLSCSIELKPQYSLVRDVLPLHGKDEQLEVADKKALPLREAETFVRCNREILLPQALFTLCSYLESMLIFMLRRTHRQLIRDTVSVIAKDGSRSPCGDTCYWGENYIAVIDGATPKGEMLWDGLKGDVFVSHLVADAVSRMDPGMKAAEAVAWLNDAVKAAYAAHGVDFSALLPEERLQCSVLIYSAYRREVWSFGDCMLSINGRCISQVKRGDALFADLRAFCVQIERDRLGPDADPQALSDYGRSCILPYIRAFTSLANRNVPFGYDVIDGGRIIPGHVKVYAVQQDDAVVMASDGYPKLFGTLEETEAYLKNALAADPWCLEELRGTKGVAAGNESFDDRTYVSFRVQ